MVNVLIRQDSDVMLVIFLRKFEIIVHAKEVDKGLGV